MTSKVKGKKIRALYGFTKAPDGEFGQLLVSALDGLTENADIYDKTPIDLAVYRTAIDAYQALLPAALDGSKTAIAHKNRLREDALRMYVQLAHYAEANCNDDIATFLLSGFR